MLLTWEKSHVEIWVHSVHFIKFYISVYKILKPVILVLGLYFTEILRQAKKDILQMWDIYQFKLLTTDAGAKYSSYQSIKIQLNALINQMTKAWPKRSQKNGEKITNDQIKYRKLPSRIFERKSNFLKNKI